MVELDAGQAAAYRAITEGLLPTTCEERRWGGWAGGGGGGGRGGGGGEKDIFAAPRTNAKF